MKTETREHACRLIYDIVREPATEPAAEPLSDSARTAALFRSLQSQGLIPREREAVCVLCLDSRHAPLGCQVVSVGTVSMSLTHPREVFRPAIALGASAIIMAHNHPSGCVTPSTEDIAVTERIGAAGELLGIELLDSIVIGAEKAHSIRYGTDFVLSPATEDVT